MIVPALHMIPVVDEFRLRHDPSARAGVPPHITVMYPFLDPGLLTDENLRKLGGVFASTLAFEYTLAELREFDAGVLYLAPEPADPFITLTERVGDTFDLAPYGGVHDRVVPHLTVSQIANGSERAAIRAAVEPSLPQAAEATEAWLMVGSNEIGWRKARAIAFG